ncbi:MAG: hypothetical protein CSA68_09625 [Rhodobacterales bacterium]|nr:MAG: hypothetical protein CSA68_09625 [Rhodobacterales bacterium]
MTDLMSLLKSLQRPRMLIRAARFGISDYNRSRDLRHLLRSAVPPSPGQAIVRLVNEERLLEEKRKAGDASYSITRHVMVLIAMMGEARLLQATNKQANALT